MARIESNNPCVRLLSSALELARSGEVSSVVVLYCTEDGDTHRERAGEIDSDYQQLIYLLQAENHDIIREIESD